MKKIITKLPAGEIVNVRTMRDGSYEITQFVEEDKSLEEVFEKVEASKLSTEDRFLQYKPGTYSQSILKSLIILGIESGYEDFYAPKYDPSFGISESGLCFMHQSLPALGKPFAWWKEAAKKFNPERKSRLGTKNEYVAFLAVILKHLVENENWEPQKAWESVCDDSTELRAYPVAMDTEGFNDDSFSVEIKLNSNEHRRGFLSAREVAGFFDLGNTLKFLTEEREQDLFWLAGGHCDENNMSKRALAILEMNYSYPDIAKKTVGWIVLEN